MELQFGLGQIAELASRYDAELKKRDRRLTTAVTERIFPAYRRRGYLTKAEFLDVCEWKSPRPRRWCESNAAALIKEVSAWTWSTKSEQLRIQAWTLLAGVNWPTASVFVHFAFPDRYPIMDYRALESLQTKVPNPYTFQFWRDYTRFCRKLAREAGVTLRTLDKALWKYSQQSR